MEEALGLLCEVCILWCGCSLWYCEVRWGRVKLGPVLRFKNITHSHVMTGGPDTGETDRLTFDPGRTYGCVKMCMVQVQWYVRVYWCALVLVQWYDKHVWCRQWCVLLMY